MTSTNNGCHGAPLEPEEVEKWFDSDGRLVKEASMRKTLFEGTCSTINSHPSNYYFQISY